MKYLLYIILFVSFNSCTNREKTVDKKNLLGKDYRLFQGTPIWNLAKAVWDEDLVEIEKIVKLNKVDPDFQEPRYGKTLLMLSILNQQYKSCEKLLEVGANPNQHDKYDGSSAIIEAAAINGTSDDNTAFLKLLLKYKADPNDIEVGKRRHDNLGRSTPLLKACSSINKIISPLSKVSVLVNAGADINYAGEFFRSPLANAVLVGNYDIVAFFLDRNINYKVPMFMRYDKAIYLQDVLREATLPLDSKEYEQKLKVIELLKEKGIDYKALPIPVFVIAKAKKMYPESWKDYLSKY